MSSFELNVNNARANESWIPRVVILRKDGVTSLRKYTADKVTIMPAIKPPTTPSQVFPGLILLASMCFPNFFPTK